MKRRFRAADGEPRALLPERKLLWAVLQRAAWDAAGSGIGAELRKTSSAKQKTRDDARAWIGSDDAELFSFVHLCEELGLDVHWMRERLLADDAATRRRG